MRITSTGQMVAIGLGLTLVTGLLVVIALNVLDTTTPRVSVIATSGMPKQTPPPIPEKIEPVIAKAATPEPTASWRRNVRIVAGRDRQFYVDAKVNREGLNFLIDTGAGFVALREGDARKAGLRIRPTDYKYTVQTANGTTKAAKISIEEIRIDGIRVRNVEGFVLPDNKLAKNLLGMSFLSRLRGVETRRNEMILKG